MAKVISRPYNPKSSGLQSHMGVCRHKRNKVGIGLLLQLKRRSIMKKIDIYSVFKNYFSKTDNVLKYVTILNSVSEKQ